MDFKNGNFVSLENKLICTRLSRFVLLITYRMLTQKKISLLMIWQYIGNNLLILATKLKTYITQTRIVGESLSLGANYYPPPPPHLPPFLNGSALSQNKCNIFPQYIRPHRDKVFLNNKVLLIFSILNLK